MNPRLYPLSKETFDGEIWPLIEAETKRMGGRPPKIDHSFDGRAFSSRHQRGRLSPMDRTGRVAKIAAALRSCHGQRGVPQTRRHSILHPQRRPYA